MILGDPFLARIPGLSMVLETLVSGKDLSLRWRGDLRRGRKDLDLFATTESLILAQNEG